MHVYIHAYVSTTNILNFMYILMTYKNMVAEYFKELNIFGYFILNKLLMNFFLFYTV